MFTPARRSPLYALALALMTATAQAQSDVTFIDGGFVELCSDVAKAVDKPTGNTVTLTGTRLPTPPLEICTMAIDTAAGVPFDLAASYNNRGVIHYHNRNYEIALKDFDQSVAIKGDLAAAHINRGYVLMALKRWQESLAAFNKGIVPEAPELAKAHFNRGIVHEELGHVREAYFDYLKASELAPEWAEPRTELGRFTVKRK